MHLFQPFRLLAISGLLSNAFAKPLNNRMLTELQPAYHDLLPRQEFDFGRWHLIIDELPQAFLPESNVAFWSFEFFLSSIISQIAANFLMQPPSRTYSMTMGLLQLYAESMTNEPIDWETMNWLVARLLTWVEGGWTGCEMNAWITDLWTERGVKVSLRTVSRFRKLFSRACTMRCSSTHKTSLEGKLTSKITHSYWIGRCEDRSFEHPESHLGRWRVRGSREALLPSLT